MSYQTKIIICGSRSINDSLIFRDAIEKSRFFEDISKAPVHVLAANTLIIHGNEEGIDKLADKFAVSEHIDRHHVKADWNLYGKSAGPKRNQKMVDMALPNGCLLAIWDGYSHGTLDCINRAHKAGLTIYVYMPDIFTCAQLEADRISKKFKKT